MPKKVQKVVPLQPSILDTAVVRLFANILNELTQALISTNGVNAHVRGRLNVLLYRLVRLLAVINHNSTAPPANPRPDSTS